MQKALRLALAAWLFLMPGFSIAQQSGMSRNTGASSFRINPSPASPLLLNEIRNLGYSQDQFVSLPTDIQKDVLQKAIRSTTIKLVHQAHSPRTKLSHLTQVKSQLEDIQTNFLYQLGQKERIKLARAVTVVQTRLSEGVKNTVQDTTRHWETPNNDSIAALYPAPQTSLSQSEVLKSQFSTNLRFEGRRQPQSEVIDPETPGALTTQGIHERFYPVVESLVS
ncbi:MAG: hypothetical protein HY400_03630, partial [Elusimicrobia bacterium]|nr:hypothetical protein [Elusimicrobiota bacterium]